MSRATEIWYLGMQNMAPGGLLCHGRKWFNDRVKYATCSGKWCFFKLGLQLKNTWVCENVDVQLRKDVVACQCVRIHVNEIQYYSICHMRLPAHGCNLCVCLPVLHFKYSHCVYTVRVSLSAWLCLCMWVSTGCLGAGGAGGALQGGLREASGEGSDAGVCQRGGREQLIPATDCGRQVQVLQKDLGHSHEALVVHTPIIPPHYYLQRRSGMRKCFYTLILITHMIQVVISQKKQILNQYFHIF